MRNLIESKNRRDVGVTDYGDENITSSMLTNAMQGALGSHSKELANQYDKGAKMLGQQSTLSNALSQAQTQNMMYAGQQAQIPYDMMSQTGMGLLQRGLYGS